MGCGGFGGRGGFGGSEAGKGNVEAEVERGTGGDPDGLFGRGIGGAGEGTGGLGGGGCPYVGGALCEP